MKTIQPDGIRKMVQERYGKIATSAGACGCKSSSLNCCSRDNRVEDVNAESVGYSKEDLKSVFDEAYLGLGCGNPSALARLNAGEIVLDLGCGAGFDCFLVSKAVGPKGRVIGVDMTPEMLAKARGNALKTESTNVEFRLGEIEHLPVADNSVDVIISNCVINLSPEKERVFREAFRVLRSGGRLAISDVVAIRELPDTLKEQAELITGCVAGAARIETLETMLGQIGFHHIQIRIRPQSEELIHSWLPERSLERYIASAEIEAVKP